MTHIEHQHLHDSDPPISRAKLRKQRLARLGVFPTRNTYQKKIKPLPPHPYDFAWDQMWFYDLVFGKPKAQPTARKIQTVTAEHYGVSAFDLLSRRKNNKTVIPRQVAMYVTSLLTPQGYSEIGRRFGGRDRSTARHACQKIESLIGVDQNITSAVARIRGNLT